MKLRTSAWLISSLATLGVIVLGGITGCSEENEMPDEQGNQPVVSKALWINDYFRDGSANPATMPPIVVAQNGVFGPSYYRGNPGN